MQIVIDELEIQEALYDYCSSRVKIPEGKAIQVEFVAGRGGNGPRATIDFVDPTSPDVKKTVKEIEDIIEKASTEDPVQEAPEPKKAAKKEPKVEEPVSDALFGGEVVEPEKDPVPEEVTGDSLFNL